MAVGDVYRLSVVGAASDQTIVNTFHYLQTSTYSGTRTPPQEIISRWTAGPTGSPMATYAQMLPSAWSSRELNCMNVHDPLDNSSEQVSYTGSRGLGEILPPQCCGLLSYETQGRGRSYRGRSYIGPVLENDQAGGTITTSYSNALLGFVNAHNVTFNSAPFAWVIFSRKLNNSFAVTRIHIRLFVATQRRRSRYNPG